MKQIRTAAWAGIAVVALAATTACGAEAAKKTVHAVDQADTIMSALTRASDNASKLGSAEVRTTTTITANGGKPVSMNGTYSWGDGAALDVQMDTVNAQMQSLQDDPTLTMKMVDGAYFYEVDPQPSGPLKGKHWMRIELSAIAGESGAKSMLANADPTASLRYIGASKNVKKVGDETIRGKKTTHYRGSVGAEQINSSRLTAQEKKAAVTAMVESGGKMSLDVWVDGKDLPVRFEQRGGGTNITMDFLKFGATKPVTAPPAADTGDLTEQVRKQRDASLDE